LPRPVENGDLLAKKFRVFKNLAMFSPCRDNGQNGDLLAEEVAVLMGRFFILFYFFCFLFHFLFF